MGNRENYYWDDEKSHLLKSERGKSLADICDMVFYSPKTLWQVFENTRYPGQYRIIALHSNDYITLAIEDVSDDFGEFTKLITWWPSSANEIERFNNER